MKKLLSVLLTVMLLLSAMPISAASEYTGPTIYVDTVNAVVGESVSVSVNLANNPGIVSMRLAIGYDESILELTGYTAGAPFGSMAFGPASANPFVANWVDSVNPNVTTDGAFVTLNFKIKDTAPEGVTPISVSYNAADVYNYDFEDVSFNTQNGGVDVSHCKHLSTIDAIENKLELTCTQSAQYDKVTYCNDCGKVVARERIITQYAQGHIFGNDNECSVCGMPKFTEPTIYTDNVNGVAGENVSVKVNLANNPGIISMKLGIGYNAEALELISYTPGTAFGRMAFGPKQNNPFVANWVDSVNPDVTSDGEFVTLTFKIKDTAPEGFSPITVSYNAADVYNYDFEDVTFSLAEGGVNISYCEHISTTTVVENELSLTCTQSEQYDSVIYCDDCGSEVSRETVITQYAQGHIFGSDTKCSVCGMPKFTKPTIYTNVVDGQIGDSVSVNVSLELNPGIVSAKLKIEYDESVLELTGYTPGNAFVGMSFGPKDNNPFIANWVDTLNPDVTDNGAFVTLDFRIKDSAPEGFSPITVSYDAADIYNFDFEDVTFDVENGGVNAVYCLHKNQTTAVENRVEPTCTEDGSYENVTYCERCDEELLRETVVIEAVGHTEGEVVVENRVEADCVNAGSYENVVYCTACGEELSRETVVIEAKGHDLTTHDAKAPTCTEIGWDAYDTCSRCDYTTYKEISPVGHSYGEVTVIKPQYKVEGYSTHTCTVCGYEEKFDFTDPLTYISGDLSGDGRINNKDLGVMMQYLNNWGITIIVEAADTNGDGRVNNKDYGLLMQYLNNWGVELG